MGALFEIEIPSTAGTAFRVVSFTGKEEVSRLYRFDVRVATPKGADDLTPVLLQQPVSLVMLRNGSRPRRVNGIIGSVELEGDFLNAERSYRLRIVPRLALLKRARTRRIFQGKDAVEIVSAVLDQHGLQERQIQLAANYRRRTYCVQYDETDFAFVARLLASEGIFYYFDHPQPGDGNPASEKLIISDTARFYPPLDDGEELVSRHESGLEARDDQVFGFRARTTIRSRTVLVRGYDFRRPPIELRDARVAGTATEPLEENGGPQDKRDLSPAEAALLVSPEIARQRQYRHEGSYEETPPDPSAAIVHLEAERADVLVCEATSQCNRLIAGKRFVLEDHAPANLNRSYVLLSVEHTGFSPDVLPSGKAPYQNHFTCAPAGARMRPRTRAKPLRQTIETALVVGPPGQEIFTDDVGRVKVQFRWDLDGSNDENSSCFLRVAQPWAGSGYGTQFLPRVGHEVLVAYLDGDIDRPVVIGGIHNALNSPPFSFPRDMTRSGIRTLASPGGESGHELVFEDRIGSEFVSLRSNGTMNLSAISDTTLNTDGDFTLKIAGDRNESALGNMSTTIEGELVATRGGNRTTTIGGSDSVEIAKDHKELVGGNDIRNIAGMSLEIVGASRSTVVGTDPSRPTDDQLSVSGRLNIASVKGMTLSSKTRIQLRCGNSRITLNEDDVLIESPTIQLQAKKRIALVQGDPPEATLSLQGSAALGGGTVSVVGGGKGGGKLFLDADAHLDGALVKLNCGPMGGAGGSVVKSSDEDAKVRFTVLREGIPVGVEVATLVIATPSGEVVERECPVGGSVEIEAKKGETFVLLETRIGATAVPVRAKTPTSEEG